MITLLISYYAQDPEPAVASALRWMPAIDNVCTLEGRYEGFELMSGDDGTGNVFESEHEKRTELLRMADETAPGGPSKDRWLFILDCDEHVIYGSPQLHNQLKMVQDDVAGAHAIEPLPPDTTDLGKLLAGLGEPGRSVRDHTVTVPRLIRHLPGLEYRNRHDFLVKSDGTQLLGWENEGIKKPQIMDLQYVHFWWDLPTERKNAKAMFYSSGIRQQENVAWGADWRPKPVDPDSSWGDE